jgi:hypothetical protein
MSLGYWILTGYLITVVLGYPASLAFIRSWGYGPINNGDRVFSALISLLGPFNFLAIAILKVLDR